MPLRTWWGGSSALASPVPSRLLRVTAEDWLRAATDAAAAGGQLLALWAAADSTDSSVVILRAALQWDLGVLVLELAVRDGAPYPGLQDVFPAASRMQRAAFDLVGVRSNDIDRRPWVRHAAWHADTFPLRSDAPLPPPPSDVTDAYGFVRVEGDGVHEIAVGPVHAGTIEPGHFRFSVVGEKVLRLEERLGYAHKGIERRFTQLTALQGHRLAARVSGDCAVAYSWAYCQALEALSGYVPPRRAAFLRGLCLEIERIQNHLGDLGALGNDAGFAFGLVQFSRLKEELLRTVEVAFGQRYLLDAIVPGGMRVDLTADGSRALADRVARLAAETLQLRNIYDEHSGLRDRFVGAGQVLPELARRLGLIGLAGRASGQPFDARVDLPSPPFDSVVPVKVVRQEGDVAARVAVRFDELQESCQLVQLILQRLPRDVHLMEVPRPAANTLGTGLIESWRGPVFVALEVDSEGMIRRCHPHDPSWQNWPVLEHAILGNIVPDFPLINKSFNLSYSGHDL
jgi:Ni,Fe-hydrogenase III large subunit/Ni,Fe-hydrogenase III component G